MPEKEAHNVFRNQDDAKISNTAFSAVSVFG